MSNLIANIVDTTVMNPIGAVEGLLARLQKQPGNVKLTGLEEPTDGIHLIVTGEYITIPKDVFISHPLVVFGSLKVYGQVKTLAYCSGDIINKGDIGEIQSGGKGSELENFGSILNLCWDGFLNNRSGARIFGTCCVAEVGSKNGVFKGEIFVYNKGELKFCDIAKTPIYTMGDVRAFQRSKEPVKVHKEIGLMLVQRDHRKFIEMLDARDQMYSKFAQGSENPKVIIPEIDRWTEQTGKQAKDVSEGSSDVAEQGLKAQDVGPVQENPELQTQVGDLGDDIEEVELEDQELASEELDEVQRMIDETFENQNPDPETSQSVVILGSKGQQTKLPETVQQLNVYFGNSEEWQDVRKNMEDSIKEEYLPILRMIHEQIQARSKIEEEIDSIDHEILGLMQTLMNFKSKRAKLVKRSDAASAEIVALQEKAKQYLSEKEV